MGHRNTAAVAFAIALGCGCQHQSTRSQTSEATQVESEQREFHRPSGMNPGQIENVREASIQAVPTQPSSPPPPPSLDPIAPAPKPAPTHLPDGVSIAACSDPPANMSCVPGGPFIRGSDDGPDNTRPTQEVWLQTYYIDRFEVTIAEYRACIEAGKCRKWGPFYPDFRRPHQPLVGISWHSAKRYCRVQGKQLPTEAQWEKAARGDDGRRYAWGNEPATCQRAIIADERGRSCGVPQRGGKHPDKGRTFVVGSRPPGSYGLFDMTGNAWEYVSDWYEPSYARCGAACSGVDPKGPCDGARHCKGYTHKLVKGGSWYWGPQYATAFYRRPQPPNNQPFHHFGFRCAATVTQAEAIAHRPRSPHAPDPAAPSDDSTLGL